MEQKLLKQLNKWHNNGEYEKIVEKILKFPENEWDYDLVSHLARACNNLDQYDYAIELLLSVKDQGENDSLWHFRMGYAHFYLEMYNEALQDFEMACKLDPTDTTAEMFVVMSKKNLSQYKKIGSTPDSGDSKVVLELWINEEEIKPFKIVVHPSSVSLILNVGEYKNHIFLEREDDGFEGNGYDWTSLAEVFIEEKLPEFEGYILFDPEGSMFCAYSEYPEALQQFAFLFYKVCEDENQMRDLLSRAELD